MLIIGKAPTRISRLGICFNTGRTHFKKGFSPWNKGLKKETDTRLNYERPTTFKKGKHASKNTEFKRKYKLLGYHGLHDWVKSHLGTAKSIGLCSMCGGTVNLEWSNKSFKYKKRLDDWFVLCRFCHKKYDYYNGWGLASRKYPEIRRRLANDDN